MTVAAGVPATTAQRAWGTEPVTGHQAPLSHAALAGGRGSG